MKYIRTEDGIYEVIELHTTTNKKGSFISDYFCKGFWTVLAENVIDIANTIEELCDEFVVVDKEDNYHHLTLKIELYDIIDYEIYGANWTDKGLIYVAKMNDKGELELL